MIEDHELPVGVSFASDGDRLIRELRTPGGTARTSVATTGLDDPHGDWWMAYLRGERAQPFEPPSSRVRFVDLFCGPGGLTLGHRQAVAELGMSSVPLAAVDQDAGAVEVYAANHRPELTSSESVKTHVDYRVRGTGDGARFRYQPQMVGEEWNDLVGRTDVVLAGPPCQGHSNLNNRTRRSDPRNELYLAVPAAAIALGAPVVIIENVPSVVHDKLGVVATSIALLRDAGYHLTEGVLHADRLGWSQRRSRYFLVARRDREPIPLQTVSHALANEERPITWALQNLSPSSAEDFMSRTAELSPQNQSRIDWLFDNDAYDLALTERPDCHKDGTSYMSVYGRLHPDRAAPTITTGFLTPGRGRFTHPTERRTLNPREAARLQGFPDTYRFQTDPAVVPAKVQLGKWIGDAVPMPLGYAATLAALGPGWPANP